MQLSNKNPVTLFTGQWADMPLEDMASFAKSAGFDGLELACWGNHFDVRKAVSEGGRDYISHTLDILKKYELGVWSFGAHLVGQAVSAKFANDPDLLAILPEHIRSDNAETVRRAAVAELQDTAKAVELFREVARSKFGTEAIEKYSANVITGFVGSPIWHKAYEFPPVRDNRAEIQKGFEEVVNRMNPVLDTFASTGNKFALEVHPTEIAFDTVTAHKLLDSIQRPDVFGVNNDASHFGYQGVNYLKYIDEMANRGALFHSHMKDVAWGLGDGVGGVHGSHLEFGDPKRYWDFKSIGRGNIDNKAVVQRLVDKGYEGPLSIEWEDALLKRQAGATASQLIVRGIRDSNDELIQRGMKMYEDKDNYARAKFDSAFAK